MKEDFSLAGDGAILHLGYATCDSSAFEKAFCQQNCAEGDGTAKSGRAAKLATVVAMVLAVLIAAFSFAGCAASTDSGEEAIRASLTEELGAVKSLDASFVDEVLAGMGDSDFDQLGVSAQDFLSKYFEGFDYAIDVIEIDGDKAFATVTLHCKSFRSFCSSVDYESKRILGNTDVSALQEDELNALVGEIVFSSLDQAEVSACEPVVFEYELVDGQWVQGDAYASVLVDALTSN